MHLITERATKWLMARGKLQNGDSRQREDSHLGGDRAEHMRFQHSTQNGTQLKTYELFTSGIFHLIFLDNGWPWVTEIPESKTMAKGGPLWKKQTLRGRNNVPVLVLAPIVYFVFLHLRLSQYIENIYLSICLPHWTVNPQSVGTVSLSSLCPSIYLRAWHGWGVGISYVFV